MDTPSAGRTGDVAQVGNYPSGALVFLSLQRKYRESADAEGQRLYLPRTGEVVIPRSRYPGGWYCSLADAPEGRRQPIPDVEIATALTAPDRGTPLSAISTAVYLMVWQARAHHRVRHGRGPLLAQRLASKVRPADRSVTLAPAVVDWLLPQVDATRAELRQALADFCDAGLLHTRQPAEGRHWGVHTLALPAEPPAAPVSPTAAFARAAT